MLALKKNVRYGKNISRIFLETLLKSQISTEEIIDGQLDIKLGSFMEEELDAVLKKKVKAEKLQALTNYL